MGRRKKPEELDNIERCVAASEAMGFGLHYGNYMAWKERHERDAGEVEEIAAKEPEVLDGKPIRRCRQCGGIVKWPRKEYCSDECRYQFRLEKDRYEREHGLKRAYTKKAAAEET